MSIHVKFSAIAIMLSLLLVNTHASAQQGSAGSCTGVKPYGVRPPIQYRPDDSANPICPSKRTQVAGHMTCTSAGSGSECKTSTVAISILSARYTYSSSERSCHIAGMEDSGIYITSGCSNHP